MVAEKDEHAERVDRAGETMSDALQVVRRMMESGEPVVDGADLDTWTMRFIAAAHMTGWALNAEREANAEE